MLQCSIAGMDRVVIRDVVAIIAKGRGKKWHEPYRADPQFLEVIEFLFKPEEITNPIAVAVVECADMNLIYTDFAFSVQFVCYFLFFFFFSFIAFSIFPRFFPSLPPFYSRLSFLYVA